MLANGYQNIVRDMFCIFLFSLPWRHNGRDGVSNHQPNDCLLNRLYRRRSKKTPELRVTGLCMRNSPVTGEFPAQMASNAENVSISWRHHVVAKTQTTDGGICVSIGALVITRVSISDFTLVHAFTQNKILSIWQLCRHWWHRKLSLR